MNGLNVFKGPESVTRYFDPDANPPLPLVEIPARLNPFREDGVRIYAKMLTALPAHNVKSLPGESTKHRHLTSDLPCVSSSDAARAT